MPFKISKRGECIRTVANYSTQVPSDKFDKNGFNMKSFAEKIPETSPKLLELIRTINAIDKADMEKHNKLFKHIIYTDVKKSSAGAKMIAAGLSSNGFRNVYGTSLKLDAESIKNNPYNNFALLCSVNIYNKPFPVKLKKNILSMFNSRPDNVQGELIRFIILDQGFKEGIDVFDVKYIHLFEPSITSADEKQAIGRGTRFCGQKGLTFDPDSGWPLHVIKYDIRFDDVNKRIYNVDGINDLFMANSGIDLSKLNFASELEMISKYGAVDYELTKKMHMGRLGTLSKSPTSSMSPRSVTSQLVESPSSNMSSQSGLYTRYRRVQDNPFNLSKKVSRIPNIGGGIKGKKKKGINVYLARAPRKQKTFLEMRNYVRERFLQNFEWKNMKFENKCDDAKEDTENSRIVKYTPTQEFVSKYFDNSSANKGLLLWHSVGTGKTCSAIAAASNGFEKHGYSILWVTRHTLKSDIWKNMFEKVCSVTIKKQIEKGEKIPINVTKNPLKYVSNNWIMPISYKQFTNMLAEKNDIYKTMKKRNGVTDPLKKTLVIIDEVHKLYASDLPPQERPNLKILKAKLRHSYKVSGKDSVRLLLMSATPYTSDPMDLIKIINLMQETDMPEDFAEFKQEFLNQDAKFTTNGAKNYLDKIAGHISYLNREKDVRQFAYPVFYNVTVPMSLRNNTDKDRLVVELEDITTQLNDLQGQNKKGKSKEEVAQLKADISELKKRQKEVKKLITKEKNKLDFSQESALIHCMKK
jgi:superfamily II DNA or RNA helicase